MHPTHNTLPDIIRAQSVNLLNKHLAAAIDLQAQTRQAHWNVRGPGFIAIHRLFDNVSEEVGSFSDMLAERAGALGGTAQVTIQVATTQSFLIPYDLGIADENSHILAVSAALAAYGQSVREAISLATATGDFDTADLLAEVSRGIGRQLWLVESHAQLKSPKSNVVGLRSTGVVAVTKSNAKV